MTDEQHGDDFIIDDFKDAIGRTHDLGEPVPARMTKPMMDMIINLTSEANIMAGRRMGYGAILSWGITIGVFAERARRWRSQREQEG